MSDIVKVQVKQLDNNIELPKYAYEGDAGTDLRASQHMVLAPGQRAMVPCGIAIAIPDGYCGLVIPRSGLAAKHGISVVNAPGLVDSGYRGELKVILVNLDQSESFTIEPGDRIAQLVISKVPTVQLEPVDELPQSQRGEGGFGSSGVKN